jgi:hypothetical protein
MIVALLALCMAALFSAAGFWISVAATITLGVLLAAVMGAILLRGAERAFCLGFSLFAGVYLVLVDWDWVGGQFGHDLTLALSELSEWIYSEPAAARSARANPFLTQLPIELLQARQGKIGNFVEVGRMLLALLFGFLGGFIGSALVVHRDRQGEERAVHKGEALLRRE